MTFTRTAGGVVVHRGTGKIVVTSQNGDSWSLPKGHQDAGEDDIMTALREIREETGLHDLTLVGPLGEYRRHPIGKGGVGERMDEMKTLVFFHFTTETDELAPEDPNNPEACWVEMHEALGMLTHPEDRAFLERVMPRIIKDAAAPLPKAPGFLWGAAMAGHQVEGGGSNDWTRWEGSEGRLRQLEARGDLARHGKENYLSGAGVDHWNRYREDIDLAALMGLNALRISVEWSRIEPTEGAFSEEALGHYRAVVQEMRAKGIEPVVTLWHWPLPLWLADRGGWTWAGTPALFARYTEKVVEALGGEVRYWVTLNEPEIYTTHSYLYGIWPPQKKNPFTTLRALRNLVAGHRAAHAAIKRVQPGSMVGIAKNNIWFEAARGTFLNRTLAGVGRFFWNDLLLRMTDETTDFVGINHYFHNLVDGAFLENTDARKSDMGWGLNPEALYHVLMQAAAFKKPIIVTENGLADAKDAQRAWFLQESIAQMMRAKKDGADVRGYLHWSLLDNFEWDKGYWPQFGLIAVDRKTMRRTPRGSARTYAEIIRRFDSGFPPSRE